MVELLVECTSMSLRLRSRPKSTFTMRDHFICTSENLVYCISCRRCSHLHIGETVLSFFLFLFFFLFIYLFTYLSSFFFLMGNCCGLSQRGRGTGLGTFSFSPFPCVLKRTIYGLRLAAITTVTGNCFQEKVKGKLKKQNKQTNKQANKDPYRI